MNVIFISPHFPDTYWNFCEQLRARGATVLGVGDTPYDMLDAHVKGALDEYYWVHDLNNYEQAFKAVAYFSYHYGKIDWLESNNEHWLALDARLRTDFNICTGAKSEQMTTWQSKAAMKGFYAAAGIPSARQIRAGSRDEARAFAWEVAYPLFAKPEYGVGSSGTVKIENETELDSFFDTWDGSPYVLEEYVVGEICSYDALVDAHGKVVFENQTEFPPSMHEVTNKELDMAYFTCPVVDERLRQLGRAAIASFDIVGRFVHAEFFRLTQDKPGLAAAGDYAGLEVNMRPPGGYTPDMINFAHSSDVYALWADMVTTGTSTPEPGEPCFCAYAGRRDSHSYAHSHEDILTHYEEELLRYTRIPDALSDDLGNQMYMARMRTAEEKTAFLAYVLEQKPEEKPDDTHDEETPAE